MWQKSPQTRSHNFNYNIVSVASICGTCSSNNVFPSMQKENFCQNRVLQKSASSADTQSVYIGRQSPKCFTCTPAPQQNSWALRCTGAKQLMKSKAGHGLMKLRKKTRGFKDHITSMKQDTSITTCAVM